MQTVLVQLCGDTCGGYLANGRGRDNRGYSAVIFDNVVSPAAGQAYVNRAVRILKELKLNQDRETPGSV